MELRKQDIHEIILDVVAKGEQKNKAYENMLSNRRNKKPYTYLLSMIKFDVKTIRKVQWAKHLKPDNTLWRRNHFWVMVKN